MVTVQPRSGNNEKNGNEHQEATIGIPLLHSNFGSGKGPITFNSQIHDEWWKVGAWSIVDCLTFEFIQCLLHLSACSMTLLWAFFICNIFTESFISPLYNFFLFSQSLRITHIVQPFEVTILTRTSSAFTPASLNCFFSIFPSISLVPCYGLSSNP